jgi:hypothetical protein
VQRLIFREGRTKGIGRVVSIHHQDGTTDSLDAEQFTTPATSSAPAPNVKHMPAVAPVTGAGPSSSEEEGEGVVE